MFFVSCRNTSPFEDHSCIVLVSAIEGKHFQLKGSWEVFQSAKKVGKRSACYEKL